MFRARAIVRAAISDPRPEQSHSYIYNSTPFSVEQGNHLPAGGPSWNITRQNDVEKRGEKTRRKRGTRGTGRTGTENNRANNLRDYRGPGCWFPIGWARPLAAYLVPASLSLSLRLSEKPILLFSFPHPCRPFCIFHSAFHVLPRATRKSTVNNARSSELRPALPACRIAETLFSFMEHGNTCWKAGQGTGLTSKWILRQK